MPYVEIDMKDGTLCDLNNKPRSIKVLYVCYQHGKHEIFSLKEISSCEYEAVVLSPLLCSHPDYRPQDTGENEINCRPVDSAPKKPRSLMQLEAESLKLRHQKVAVIILFRYKVFCTIIQNFLFESINKKFIFYI